jgi:hypothetical protein
MQLHLQNVLHWETIGILLARGTHIRPIRKDNLEIYIYYMYIDLFMSVPPLAMTRGTHICPILKGVCVCEG